MFGQRTLRASAGRDTAAFRACGPGCSASRTRRGRARRSGLPRLPSPRRSCPRRSHVSAGDSTPRPGAVRTVGAVAAGSRCRERCLGSGGPQARPVHGSRPTRAETWPRVVGRLRGCGPLGFLPPLRKPYGRFTLCKPSCGSSSRSQSIKTVNRPGFWVRPSSIFRIALRDKEDRRTRSSWLKPRCRRARRRYSPSGSDSLGERHGDSGFRTWLACPRVTCCYYSNVQIRTLRVRQFCTVRGAL